MGLISNIFGPALVVAAVVNGAPSSTHLELPKRGLATSAKPTYNGCTYVVNGVGSFTDGFSVDFTKATTLGPNLIASSETINAGVSPFARTFFPKNVVINKGAYLGMKVPGGQTQGPISSAEIQTAAKDILYASFRTVAMASNVAGTTHGFTFYSNDTQEADIAFLTYENSDLHLTNEQTSYSSPATSDTYPAPKDATTAWHEYRMDWVKDKTMFYIDGKLIHTITENVPSTPGFGLVNNWSNGNAWAKGPPQSDNILKVQSYAAYFNRTSHKIDASSKDCKAAAASYNAAVLPKVVTKSSATTVKTSSVSPKTSVTAPASTVVSKTTSAVLSSTSTSVSSISQTTMAGNSTVAMPPTSITTPGMSNALKLLQ